MRILVINGPNLNLLGLREPHLYGTRTYQELEDYITRSAAALGLEVDCYQSNSEGALVDCIQQAYGRYHGLIINAAAYTHTSIALLDALQAVGLPTAEVHLTKPQERESFRHHSYVSLYAQKIITGKGFEGYKEALEWFQGFH